VKSTIKVENAVRPKISNIATGHLTLSNRRNPTITIIGKPNVKNKSIYLSLNSDMEITVYNS
jgi:hypothetical protein